MNHCKKVQVFGGVSTRDRNEKLQGCSAQSIYPIEHPQLVRLLPPNVLNPTLYRAADNTLVVMSDKTFTWMLINESQRPPEYSPILTIGSIFMPYQCGSESTPIGGCNTDVFYCIGPFGYSGVRRYYIFRISNHGLMWTSTFRALKGSIGIAGDLVVYWYGSYDSDSRVVALNKSTGAVVWETFLDGVNELGVITTNLLQPTIIVTFNNVLSAMDRVTGAILPPAQVSRRCSSFGFTSQDVLMCFNSEPMSQEANALLNIDISFLNMSSIAEDGPTPIRSYQLVAHSWYSPAVDCFDGGLLLLSLWNRTVFEVNSTATVWAFRSSGDVAYCHENITGRLIDDWQSHQPHSSHQAQ